MLLSVSFVYAGGGGGQPYSLSPPSQPSATLGSGAITASPGETISIPLYVNNFSGIGSITFKIHYNQGL